MQENQLSTTIYERTGELDAEQYAALLCAAKGSGRSLRQFARECNCSAPAFSRILHQQNTGPSRPHMLEAIARNADPESHVTLEALASANGYRLRNIPITSLPCRENRTRLTHLAAGIIAENLQEMGHSGCTIRFPAPAAREQRNRPFKEILAHFTVRPDTMDEELVFIFNEKNDVIDGDNNIFTRAGGCLMIENEKADGEKLRYGILTFNEEMYESAVAEMVKFEFPIKLSVFLLNANEHKVAHRTDMPERVKE